MFPFTNTEGDLTDYNGFRETRISRELQCTANYGHQNIGIYGRYSDKTHFWDTKEPIESSYDQTNKWTIYDDDVFNNELEDKPVRRNVMSTCKGTVKGTSERRGLAADGQKSPDSVPAFIRLGATVRERTRMHVLNEAFDELRKVIPRSNLCEQQKLSKIATLRQAIQYISALERTLENSGVEIKKTIGYCVGDRRGKQRTCRKRRLT